MTKNDCSDYIFAWTTKSNGEKQIKVWYATRDDGRTYFFLDNGAECTELIFVENGEYWYEGGGWFERTLGKSFKGTSKDIEKIEKYILIGSIIIALLFVLVPMINKTIKANKK